MDYICDINLKYITISLAATLIVAACAPKSDMDKYIDGLMSRMTLEQKIGQLNLHSAPGFISAIRVTEEDETVKLLRAGQLGGLYGTGNFETPATKATGESLCSLASSCHYSGRRKNDPENLPV